MPKDYLREFDEELKDTPYGAVPQDFAEKKNARLTAIFQEAIKASKQEGCAEAVAYIRNKAPRSGTHGYVIHSSTLDDALMFDYRAAKEEKV